MVRAEMNGYSYSAYIRYMITFNSITNRFLRGINVTKGMKLAEEQNQQQTQSQGKQSVKSLLSPLAGLLLTTVTS